MKMKLTKDPSHKGYYQDEEGNLYVFRFGGRPIKVDGYKDEKPKEDVQVDEVSVEKDKVVDGTKKNQDSYKNQSMEDAISDYAEENGLSEDEASKLLYKEMSKSDVQTLAAVYNNEMNGMYHNMNELYDDLAGSLGVSTEEAKKIWNNGSSIDGEDIEKASSDSSSDKKVNFKYSREFSMESPVNDFEAANEYLKEDDMTQYLPENLKEKIAKVEWELDDESSGHIKIETYKELNEEEENELKSWIDGQNSDGLGEGFEQQEFAESYYDPYSGDGPFTRYEAEEEISRRIEDMDVSDYWDYIDESEKQAGVDNYIEMNDLEYTEDEEIRDGYLAEISDDPFSYISEDAIYEARDRSAMDNPDYNVDEWYNMSSIRSYRDFEVEEVMEETKKDYTSQELKDKYGTDDVDLINAGKPSEERVTKEPEYVYDRGDYSSLAATVKDKKYEVLETSNSAFGTELYKLKDEDGNIFYKPKSEVYGKAEKESNENLTLMNRYSGTISTLQERHPDWSMAKIMEKIKKLEEED